MDIAGLVDEQALLGARVRVLWPDDCVFYGGFITAYCPSSRQHTVSYDDGEVEMLQLAMEKIQLAEPLIGALQRPSVEGLQALVAHLSKEADELEKPQPQQQAPGRGTG